MTDKHPRQPSLKSFFAPKKTKESEDAAISKSMISTESISSQLVISNQKKYIIIII